MNELSRFLGTSYTCYQAVENAAALLDRAGFIRLGEQETWNLREGGAYYTVRAGASLIAFRYSRKGNYKFVVSHTDSPCLKLKENPALSDGAFTRLNTEPYGGGLWYTFFDRPLALAGRTVHAAEGALRSRLFLSKFRVVLPSLAVHQNREANEKFGPNLQTELPLFALGKAEFSAIVQDALAYDLFLVPAEAPFESGINGEFLSSPRIDDLSGAYASLCALAGAKQFEGTLIAALLDSEEIGSSTYRGAGGDFLASAVARIAAAQERSEQEKLCALASSLLVSLDNAHSLHPNHPEKCDPTNRAVMGGGIVIKSHAGGAYTTDAITCAAVKKIFSDAGVKFQSFYNRSDLRSGGTLGAISLGHVCVPSVDLGVAQLAMHSATETMAKCDYEELEKGLSAFFASRVKFVGDAVTFD